MSAMSEPPTSESEQVLAAVFGPEWEMTLMAAGIVGGANYANVSTDVERVMELAHEVRPDLDDDQLDTVGTAWHERWCAGPVHAFLRNNPREGWGSTDVTPQ